MALVLNFPPQQRSIYTRRRRSWLSQRRRSEKRGYCLVIFFYRFMLLVKLGTQLLKENYNLCLKMQQLQWGEENQLKSFLALENTSTVFEVMLSHIFH